MNVNVVVNYTYTGTFSESPDIKSKASSWYAGGTEVIFSCGGQICNSIFAAGQEAGKYTIGVDTDQSGDSDTVIIQIYPVRAGEELARDLAIEPGDDVICIKKRILADTTPVIYSIDYLPRALFGNRDYTRIDLSGDVFDVLERECRQQVASNVAHLKASCGDEPIRAAMRLAPGEAMLLLDEICYNRLCHPVMRSLSYYTNFFDFSILRKLL